jgi:hypothetical protein
MRAPGQRSLANLAWPAAVSVVTVALIAGLPATGYLRDVREDDITGWQPVFLALFLLFDVIWIGVPYWVHHATIGAYGPIRSVWFFAVWGGVTGAFFGEIALGASPALILPYTILMTGYGFLYRRFTWWKVALTSYAGGMLVENVLNRSPIQLPTVLWIGFFVAPYFVTRLYDNRANVPIRRIVWDLRRAIGISIALTVPRSS